MSTLPKVEITNETNYNIHIQYNDRDTVIIAALGTKIVTAGTRRGFPSSFSNLLESLQRKDVIDYRYITANDQPPLNDEEQTLTAEERQVQVTSSGGDGSRSTVGWSSNILRAIFSPIRLISRFIISFRQYVNSTLGFVVFISIIIPLISVGIVGPNSMLSLLPIIWRPYEWAKLGVQDNMALFGRLLQFVFLVTATLVPALFFFMFDRIRLSAVKRQVHRAVFRLDPSVQTMSDLNSKYGDTLDEHYGGKQQQQTGIPGSRAPVVVATVAIAIGFIMTIMPTIDIPRLIATSVLSDPELSELEREEIIKNLEASANNSNLQIRFSDRVLDENPFLIYLYLQPTRTVFSFGFIGVYLFSLIAIIRRYYTNDLWPKTYSQIVFRIIAVLTMSWTIELMFNANSILSPQNQYWDTLQLSAGATLQTPEGDVLQLPDEGSLQLSEDTTLQIADGNTVQLPDEATLQTSDGSTLQLPEGSTLQIADNTSDGRGIYQLVLILAFLIGISPDVFWQVLRQFFGRSVLQRIINASFSTEEKLRINSSNLTKIEGVDFFDKSRLEEAGILDLQMFAYQDIVKLMIQSRIAPAVFVDWLDQAILLLKLESLDPDLRKAFENCLKHHHGVRNLSDFIVLISNKPLAVQSDLDDPEIVEEIKENIKRLVALCYSGEVENIDSDDEYNPSAMPSEDQVTEAIQPMNSNYEAAKLEACIFSIWTTIQDDEWTDYVRHWVQTRAIEHIHFYTDGRGKLIPPVHPRQGNPTPAKLFVRRLNHPQWIDDEDINNSP